MVSGVNSAKAFKRAQTTSGLVVLNFTVGANDQSFLVGGMWAITIYTSGTLSYAVTYTDENGNAQTVTFGSGSSVGVLKVAPIFIRAQGGSTMQFSISGTFSATYDVEALVLGIVPSFFGPFTETITSGVVTDVSGP
jgi:hypothetical protein